MIKIKKYNSSYITVICPDFDERNSIYNYYSLPVDGYWFMPKFKSGHWDGKIHLYNKLNSQLPSGLLHHLIKYLKKCNIQYSLSPELKEELKPCDISELTDILKDSISSNIEKRDYQIQAIENIIKYRNGIIEHATGAGKTIILYYLLHYLLSKNEPFKLLFIVPTISLISQAVSDLKEFNIPEEIIGQYYSKVKETDKPIIVGTWQSLRKNENLLKSVTVALADECHGAKASEISGLLKQCTNTKMRIGMTGTLPKNPTDRLTVLGSFGPILDSISSHTLIHEKKVLSKAKIIITNLNYSKELQKKARKSYENERKIISENRKRKHLFKSILNKLNKNNKNTLVLFDKIDLGSDYKDFIEDELPSKTKLYWVEGKIDKDERENIRQTAKNSDNWIIFATLGTFSTGINIPNIHNIIFIWVGKSVTRIKQSIGRGLRLHDSKNILTIIDMSDNLKYGKKHLDERIYIYTKEGYPITIKEFNK